MDDGNPVDSLEHEWSIASSYMELPEAQALVCTLAGLHLDAAFQRILTQLERFGPANVSELARMQRVNFGFMSRSLKELAELGLVARLPSIDHRCTVVRLTDAGAATVFRLRSARRFLISEALAEWDDSDVRHLARLLRRAGSDFGALLRDPSSLAGDSLVAGAAG